VQFFNFPKEEQRNSEENKKNNINPKLCIYKLISTVSFLSALKETEGRNFPDIPNNRKESNYVVLNTTLN
jgi:hypothetical protein